MTPVRLECGASRSRVKHSTTEPLRSQLFSEIRPLIDGTLSKINSLECTDGPRLTDMKSKLKKVEGDMFYADEKVSYHDNMDSEFQSVRKDYVKRLKKIYKTDLEKRQ